MVVDGYSEDMLTTASDHLCENEKAAKGFLAKNAKLRKFWMDGYLFTRFWLVCLVLTMMVVLGIVICCSTSIHLSLSFCCGGDPLLTFKREVGFKKMISDE